MKERLLTHLCLLACFTPSGVWYVKRISAGGEESLSIFLLPLVVLFARKYSKAKEQIDWLTLSGIALYAVCWLMALPATIKALIAITVLLHYFGLLKHYGVSALAYLSLPWLSSLQFFLGYPLRRVVTELSVNFLTILGLPVEAQGTGLLFQNQHVFVDPPCSGVKMLWAGTILCAVLCSMFQFSWKKGMLVMLGGGAFLILANAIRGSVLFFPESQLVNWPAWTHEGVGLVIYALTVVSFVFVTQKLSSTHV